MTTSIERATLNELRFRAANKAIEQRRVELGVDGTVPYVCECDEQRCRELVRLSPREYREARMSENHFLLVTGHPFRCGAVVAEHDGYVVIEKTGEAAAVIAREENRRG